MKNFLLIALLIFSSAFELFSQNNMDSLNEKINSIDGKEKVELLLMAAGKSFEHDKAGAKKNINEALSISREIKYSKGIAGSYYLLGKIYSHEKKITEALKNYDNALKNLPDSNKSSIYASLISEVSEIYLNIGIYDKALENYINLLRYHRSMENKEGEAYTLSYIGKTYLDLQNGQNALKYLNEALEIAGDINDEVRISFILNSIGGVYLDLFKDNETAQNYYNRALKLSEKINYRLGIAKAYHNMGIIYYNKNELKNALEYNKKSLNIAAAAGLKDGLAYNFNSIANIYFELSQIDSAIHYFNSSLEVAKDEQIIVVISDNYKGLADSYKKKSNFKKALDYLELYNDIREKLNNEKTNQKIAELEIQYETKRKESENEILKSTNSLQKNYFIFSLVLGFLIVVVLFNRYLYSRKAHKQLEELNATKDKLFSIIGHDLKNPFGTLINFSEMLLEDYYELTDEEKITYIHMINEASQTGHEILDNLLQWSKTQSGKLEFEPQKLDLQEIIEANTALLNSSAKNKGIVIFSAVNSGTEVFVDKLMLKTVLRNLIGNAIKFSHKGGTIKIDSSTNGQFIEVTVSDNGVGITEAAKEKLFNPAVFHSTTGTANEQGTGLGLLLCKEFIEKNGGIIWVESEEGKGSDFKFTIPINS